MNGYPGAIPMQVNGKIVFTDALVDKRNQFAIVLHKTGNKGNAPTAEQQGADFQSDANIKGEEKSVHYIIDKEGVIVQCVDEKDGAGGNCCVENGYDSFWDKAPTLNNLNECTFSIEHCSGTPNGDNSDAMTDAQKLSSFKLVTYLMHKYAIGMDHVKGHNSIAPLSRKNCPGNYPWNELYAYAKNEGIMTPAGWKSIQNGLLAPNGKTVVLGFAKYIEDDETWDETNLPLEEEHGAEPVWEFDVSSGKGNVQTFTRTKLSWVNGEQVKEVPLGQELMHVQADRNNCRTIIKELQDQIAVMKQGLPVNDVNSLKADLQKVIDDLTIMVK